MSLEARLQAASAEYQKLQIDYSNAVEARQKLDAQLSENELVKKVRPILYFSLDLYLLTFYLLIEYIVCVWIGALRNS